MSRLIKELRKEHQIITETFNEVKRLGIATQEGQKMLMSAKICLLGHLKKEDEYIYPLLDNAAKRNAELKQTLEFYATNMDVISKTAGEFFEKYSNGGAGIEFGKDFGNLYAILSLRIAKEEAVIYNKIEELDL